MEEKGEIVIYQTQDGITQLDVRLDGDTVWLSQDQMAQLFERDKSVITRHISNIYSEGELPRESTSAKIAFVPQTRERTYEVTYYNLDVIISAGYRCLGACLLPRLSEPPQGLPQATLLAHQLEGGFQPPFYGGELLVGESECACGASV